MGRWWRYKWITFHPSLTTDPIDYSVGLTEMARLGTRVDGQQPLAVIHANNEDDWQQAAEVVRAAITLGNNTPEETPVIYRRITE